MTFIDQTTSKFPVDALTKLKPKESPSMKILTLNSDDTNAEKETSDLQTGRIGLAAVADKDYKIHITVEKNTVETGQDDFWFS